jgi:hypothetical protein
VLSAPLAALLACDGSTDSPSPTTDTDKDVETDADTDADTDSDADTDQTGDTATWTLPAGPGYGGRLIDSSGNPLVGEQVQSCTNTTCLLQDTDSTGHFFYVAYPPENLSLHNHENLTLSPRRSVALIPFVVPDSTAVDLGDLYVPDLPAGVAWQGTSADPQTFDAGDGLVLTMNRADVKLGIGQPYDNVAAALIPSQYVPAYPDLTETVIAVYAVHPFGATSTTPIAVSVPTTLSAGTVLNFWSIGLLGEGLSAPATGSSDGATATTDDGQGLYALTYVVISTP